ncbi:MAG TPA: fatty acid desaturase family protein [Candidatus Limnocylindria bacterium]|nr:fatty acid desaturase family protein [Candidatus Limnocylindria bacterium]
MARAWQEAISRDELAELLAMSDWRSWLSLAMNWGLVGAAMALVAAWPNLLTVIVALFVIGARQLGFAVLMHEAAHRSLFRNRALNDWVGNWLCAYPVWGDLVPYRPYHLQHHSKTWTPDDPDLNLATPFPITRRSLARKIWRDLSGQTGWKRAKATLRRDLGRSQGRVRRLDFMGTRNLRGVVITNLVLLGLLTAAGHPALYLLWMGAWFTTYSLVMRIRSIAEHAMIDDPADPLRNTRTTIARWWERLLVAPNCVNFHLEHHLAMTVPHYRLRRMHRLLHDRGVLDEACITRGYLAVLQRAASR